MDFFLCVLVLCVCNREFYFIATNLLFKQGKRFEILWNCVFLDVRVFWSRKKKSRERKEKIITDKFSLLETILIGFFIILVLWEKSRGEKWGWIRKKNCVTPMLFLNNEKLLRIFGFVAAEKSKEAIERIPTDWRQTNRKLLILFDDIVIKKLLKHGNLRWNRTIVVDAGKSLYMRRRKEISS